MNIFNKYGIKEIADVVFYSITRIGDEEFYTPVLFFDTLKVSSINKSIEIVNAKGGKGNGKLLSWNFEQDTKLKLEDALFSQMSLDVFLNGRAMAKLSPWTSAIMKLNVANKFGQKNYSIKAFPSPSLTKEEEEIIFRCAQKAGYDAKNGSNFKFDSWDLAYNHQSKYLYSSINQDSYEDIKVAENRKILMENYYNRTQPSPYPRDLAQYIDFNSKYDGVQILFYAVPKTVEKEEAISIANLKIGETIEIKRKIAVRFKEKMQENYEMKTFIASLRENFICTIGRTANGLVGLNILINIKDLINIGSENFPIDFFSGINADEQTFYVADEFLLSHLPYFLFPNYLEYAIKDLCYCDQKDKSQLAMPNKVIEAIWEEIDSLKKAGRFMNDLYELKSIDRFEKCIVNRKEGFKIDLLRQSESLKKYYQNSKEDFTIFYDEKTMQPFIPSQKIFNKMYTQKEICLQTFEPKTEERIFEKIKNYYQSFMGEEWVQNFSSKDYIILSDTGETELEDTRYILFKLIKHEYLTLKYGTVYYKMTRTVDNDTTDDTIIGTNLSIDVDSFPGEYLIVGETFIREQKTGKDQRCQFVLNRAAVSATTKIQLQAGGEPTTFSMDVDVLTPLTNKKAMMELRQYDVEEDIDEGGTYVVPQSKRHSYTQPVQTINEILVENNEIY